MTDSTKKNIISTPVLWRSIKEELGITTEEFIEQYAHESVIPGACRACGIVTYSCEPDLTRGYCYDCGAKEVFSTFALMGVI